MSRSESKLQGCSAITLLEQAVASSVVSCASHSNSDTTARLISKWRAELLLCLAGVILSFEHVATAIAIAMQLAGCMLLAIWDNTSATSSTAVCCSQAVDLMMVTLLRLQSGSDNSDVDHPLVSVCSQGADLMYAV